MTRIQDCFYSVNWDVFGDSSSDLDDHTTVVMDFIRYCVSDCIPNKTVRSFPNQKPFGFLLKPVTRSVRALARFYLVMRTRTRKPSTISEKPSRQQNGNTEGKQNYSLTGVKMWSFELINKDPPMRGPAVFNDSLRQKWNTLLTVSTLAKLLCLQKSSTSL